MNSSEELTYAYLETHPTDAARVLEQLSTEVATSLLRSLPLRLATPVLRQMLPIVSSRCLTSFNDAEVIGLLKGVGIQAGVAIMRQLELDRRSRLLTQLPTTHTIAYDLLLSYQEGTVGAWMDPHALTLTGDMTSGDLVHLIKQVNDDSDTTPYIIDQHQHLIGYIDLADLLRTNASTPLAKIAKPILHKLPAHSLLLRLEQHLGWRSASSLPVIDRSNKLVGVMTYSAMQRALLVEKNTITTQHDNENKVAGIAEAYWLGVSSLIQAVIGMFPCEQKKGDV